MKSNECTYQSDIPEQGVFVGFVSLIIIEKDATITDVIVYDLREK